MESVMAEFASGGRVTISFARWRSGKVTAQVESHCPGVASVRLQGDEAERVAGLVEAGWCGLEWCKNAATVAAKDERFDRIVPEILRLVGMPPGVHYRPRRKIPTVPWLPRVPLEGLAAALEAQSFEAAATMLLPAIESLYDVRGVGHWPTYTNAEDRSRVLRDWLAKLGRVESVEVFVEEHTDIPSRPVFGDRTWQIRHRIGRDYGVFISYIDLSADASVKIS